MGNAKKIICFCIFRALQGPECPKNIMFLYIPGLARPGMPKKKLCFCIFRALQSPKCPKNNMSLYIPGLARPGMHKKNYVSVYSGPCKARNAQKNLCFCIFRALQGPECPKKSMFLYIPGLGRPGMPKKSM